MTAVIPMAVIDTNELLNILNNEAEIVLLKNLIESNKLILIVTIDSITEVIAGFKTEHVSPRLERLKFLVEQLDPGKFIIAPSSARWLQKEFKNRGNFKKIPMLMRSQNWGILSELMSNREALEHLYQHNPEGFHKLKELKNSLKDADKVLRNDPRFLNDQQQVANLILNFKAPTNLNEVKSLVGAFKFIKGLSNTKLRRILREKEKFHFLRTYLAIICLRNLGNCLKNYDNYPELAFFKEIKKGNWYDLSFAVQASKSEFLITSDKTLKAQTNFFRSKGLVNCEGITWEDLKARLGL